MAAPPAAAFRIWTEEIGRWWPLASHSVGQADAATCAIEGIAGGRIYETTRAGEEHLWGTITLRQPPHRLAHTWHPGRSPSEATTVEVSFRPISGDPTRLELVRGGWPASAVARRADYDLGWKALLRDDYAAYVRTVVGT